MFGEANVCPLRTGFSEGSKWYTAVIVSRMVTDYLPAKSDESSILRLSSKKLKMKSVVDFHHCLKLLQCSQPIAYMVYNRILLGSISCKQLFYHPVWCFLLIFLLGLLVYHCLASSTREITSCFSTTHKTCKGHSSSISRWMFRGVGGGGGYWITIACSHPNITHPSSLSSVNTQSAHLLPFMWEQPDNMWNTI